MSEREEGYLDLPVALSSGPDLEAVLREGYIEQELLEGANQYRCERCGKLVDAKRVSHMTHTISHVISTVSHMIIPLSHFYAWMLLFLIQSLTDVFLHRAVNFGSSLKF